MSVYLYAIDRKVSECLQNRLTQKYVADEGKLLLSISLAVKKIKVMFHCSILLTVNIPYIRCTPMSLHKHRKINNDNIMIDFNTRVQNVLKVVHYCTLWVAWGGWRGAGATLTSSNPHTASILLGAIHPCRRLT